MQKQVKDYGKVVSVRVKRETNDKLMELKEIYTKLYGFELSTSDVINMLILKEAREKKVKA